MGRGVKVVPLHETSGCFKVAEGKCLHMVGTLFGGEARTCMGME